MMSVIAVQNHCNSGWLDYLNRNHRRKALLFCIRQLTHTYYQFVRVRGYGQSLDACERLVLDACAHLDLYPQERLHHTVPRTATPDTGDHRPAPAAAPLTATKMLSQNPRYRECQNARKRRHPQHSQVKTFLARRNVQDMLHRLESVQRGSRL